MGQSQQTSPSWHSYPSGSHSRPPRQPGDRARPNGIVRMLPLCLRNPGRVDTRPKFRHTCKQHERGRARGKFAGPRLVVVQLLSRVRLSCDPMDCSLPGISVHGISPGKNTGVGCHALPRGLCQPGIGPASPALAGGLFASEPPGQPVPSVCPSVK